MLLNMFKNRPLPICSEIDVDYARSTNTANSSFECMRTLKRFCTLKFEFFTRKFTLIFDTEIEGLG